MTDLLPIGTRVRINEGGAAACVGKVATIIDNSSYLGDHLYRLEFDDDTLSSVGAWSHGVLDVYQSVEEHIETLTHSRNRFGELYSTTLRDLQVAKRDLRAATSALEETRAERDELLARLDYVETLLTEVQAARLQGYTDAREEL